MLLVTGLLLSFIALTHSSECDPIFVNSQCTCGMAVYQEKEQFVVNCMNAGFNDTSILEHIPEETQVLIFTGNHIPKLPWNIFGINKNFTKLRVIDMSNNKIETILGKSFHRVPNVERLILNHNDISISADDNHQHPRIFSNFFSLMELHLTDAFKDFTDDLAYDLHVIFENSNLTKLIKIHLEQNEIRGFRDSEVFCDLPSLLDIYLGDNLLTDVHFEILCLNHLRFLDLEGNKITRFTRTTLDIFNKYYKKNPSFAMDIGENPIICDCDLLSWLNSTEILIRNKDLIKCHHNTKEERLKEFDCTSHMPSQVQLSTLITRQPLTVPASFYNFFLMCLVVFVVALLGFAVYSNRKKLKLRMYPMLNTVSSNIYYTSVGKDEQEIDV